MGPTQNAVYAILSCTLWQHLSSASSSALNASPPPFKTFCKRTLQIVSPYQHWQILEFFLQPSTNKAVKDWPVKFSALLEKLQQHGFCSLMADETKLFNQQEFLLNSNQGAPAQHLMGCVVSFAVASNQDCDSCIHKASAALGKRPVSAVSPPVWRFHVHLFSCDVHTAQGTLVSLRSTSCRRYLHGWNLARAAVHPERPA